MIIQAMSRVGKGIYADDVDVRQFARALLYHSLFRRWLHLKRKQETPERKHHQEHQNQLPKVAQIRRLRESSGPCML